VKKFTVIASMTVEADDAAEAEEIVEEALDSLVLGEVLSIIASEASS